MNTMAAYVTAVAAVLAIGAILGGWYFGPNRPPLIVYLIGVATAWAAILSLAWLIGDLALLNTLAFVCAGFALGMLAMYIAMHVYRS